MKFAKFKKITKIEKIGVKKCYDIEVEDTHNFILANGIITHNSVDLDTRYGINYVFATQSPEKIPEEVITQCKYLMIPYNADIEAFKYLFKLSGAVSWSLNVYTQRCSQLKKTMKKYQWVIIDRDKNNYEIITPLSPLSYHDETTK
jgi:hypothetical protein